MISVLLPPASRASNSARTAGIGAQQAHREVGVAGHVAVADQHRDVGGQALGAERGGRERRRHREEDDRAAVGGGQDRAVLAAGHVDADHGDVGRPAERLGDGLGQRDRVAGVGERHLVGERDVAQPLRLGLHRHDPDGTGGAGVAGPRPATANRSCRRRRSPRPSRSGSAATTRVGQRRGAAHVEHGQGQLRVEVVGQHRGDRAGEQDRVPGGRHLLGAAVPARPARR